MGFISPSKVLPRMSASRRYEILLLRFNDGQLVSDALISDTLSEMENRFGAVSWESLSMTNL
jgi:hypothetical protein